MYNIKRYIIARRGIRRTIKAVTLNIKILFSLSKHMEKYNMQSNIYFAKLFN